MSPSPAMKKRKLESEPIQGRVDVLAYKLAEAAVRQVEHKIGIGGLWDSVKDEIHDEVTQNSVMYQVNKQFAEFSKSPWFNFLTGVLTEARRKGNM